MKKYRKTIVFIVLFIVVVIGMLAIDYNLTMNNFEEPVFAREVTGGDEVSEGEFVGFGYSIFYEGNFSEDDEYRGIYYMEFRLLGRVIKTAFDSE